MRHPRNGWTGAPRAERLESRLFFSSYPLNPVYPGAANSPMTEAEFAIFAAVVTPTPTPTPTPPGTPATPTTPPAAPTTPTTPTTPTMPTTPPEPAPVEPPLPPVPPEVPVASVIRIDAGRGPHTDLNGRAWGRDEGFTGGNVSIAPYEVANTFEDPLYYTRRWGNFDYSMQVPSGTYDVRLHFADPVHTTGGKRKFNVFAEGNLVLNRFDVAGYGGGQAKLVRSLIVSVTDGALDLGFRGVVDNAILSAIEVIPRNPDGWTAMTPAPRATTESMAAGVNGKLYVFGGFFDTGVQALRASSVYDPDADTWTKIADLPRPITGAATAADGNTVWLAGGFVHDAPGKPPAANVWKYDVALDTWSAGPALPEALAGAAMVRIGRKLRVFGGVDLNGNDSADQYVLDLDLPQLGWRTSAPLPIARHHLGAAVVNGKVYAIGGQRGADPTAGRITDVHVYDWATNRWTAAASLPLARSHVTSSTFVGLGNRIVVAGGVTNGTSAGAILSDVIEYDPVANAWSHKEWMPSLRRAPVARVLANRLIVTTGASGETSLEASTWTLLL